MSSDRRAPVIRLLTAPEAAARLGVAVLEIDRLVDRGALAVLRVSARDGRRFWPADVDAAAIAAAPSPVADPPATEQAATDDVDASAGATAPAVTATPRTRTAGRRRTPPPRPRWPAYAFAPQPVRSASYLSFRDPEHVASYLQARTGRVDR